MYRNSPEAEDILLKIKENLDFYEYKIVDFKAVPQKKQTLFKLVIHHRNGISHIDCGKVAKIIQEILDGNWYNDFAIEVSSPGIGRKIEKIEDYTIFIDKDIKVYFKKDDLDRKSGEIYTITDVRENELVLTKNEVEISCNIDEIQKAVLV